MKDSHDRRANTDSAYLLDRIEAYEGLVILASNRRENVDEAFARRITLFVEFPA